jgi:DNA-binding winged helix-turn-helix (wHTH) protein
MKHIAILDNKQILAPSLKSLLTQSFIKDTEVSLIDKINANEIIDFDLLILIRDKKISTDIETIYISDKLKGNNVFPPPIHLEKLLSYIDTALFPPLSIINDFSFSKYTTNLRENKIINQHNHQEIYLTTKELILLVNLYEAPNHLKNRATLLHDIWGYDGEIDTHTLETHIYRLRKKIEHDVNNPKILLTLDEGYKLVV